MIYTKITILTHKLKEKTKINFKENYITNVRKSRYNKPEPISYPLKRKLKPTNYALTLNYNNAITTIKTSIHSALCAHQYS